MVIDKGELISERIMIDYVTNSLRSVLSVGANG